MVISLERRAGRTIKLQGDPSDQREEEAAAEEEIWTASTEFYRLSRDGESKFHIVVL